MSCQADCTVVMQHRFHGLNGHRPALQTAVRFKNNLGYTPLHLGAKLGHLRVVRELLLAGANAALKDQASGEPPPCFPFSGCQRSW